VVPWQRWKGIFGPGVPIFHRRPPPHRLCHSGAN
jgi:hypothetical protein